MRNKNHVQEQLSRIETVQQSFIQFIRNTPMTEQERVFFEKQVEQSKFHFEQIRTFLNQEDEEFNNFRPKQDPYTVNTSRF